MIGRFAKEAELGLGLLDTVEVVKDELCEPGIFQGFSESDLLFVELLTFVFFLSFFFILSKLLQQLNLRVALTWLAHSLGGLPSDSQASAVRVGRGPSSPDIGEALLDPL